MFSIDMHHKQNQERMPSALLSQFSKAFMALTLYRCKGCNLISRDLQNVTRKDVKEGIVQYRRLQHHATCQGLTKSAKSADSHQGEGSTAPPLRGKLQRGSLGCIS